MTAEIGMLNKYAAVLAADSAVTVRRGGKQKVYNSANKLFMLSNCAPVGIMIYGSATFMGIPWETIIKIYRKNILSNNMFGTLGEYADHFLKYIKSMDIDNEAQKEYLLSKALDLAFELKNEVITDGRNENLTLLSEKIQKYEEILIEHKNDIDQSFLKACNGFIHNNNLRNEINKLFFIVISETIKDVTETNLPLDQLYDIYLKYTALKLLGNNSGIVISGFGESELYPSIYSYEIEAKINNYLKFNNTEKHHISTDNQSVIVPFAQTEMVHNILRGINPNIQAFIDDILIRIFNEASAKYIHLIQEFCNENIPKNLVQETTKELLQIFRKELKGRQNKYFIRPILDTVAILNKEELASMAENLVSISSFGKQISMDLESVGGPIDVAIITKGDGFIWYKRKHYFDPELNPHFLSKKDRECLD